MKNKFKLLKWLIVVVVALGGATAMAQQNQDLTQSVCTGTQVYNVDPSPIAGASYTWSLSGGGNFTSANGTPTITVDWTTPGGLYTLSVYTTANGCPGPAQSILVTVVDPPTAPTLQNKVPPGMSVCDGTPVSATFNPGSGGIGCSDEFEYSYDGSGTWVTYTPGASLPTNGHTLVEIRARRAGCNTSLGCNGTPWDVLASWTVTTALPVTVTINPSIDPVCEGTSVTYTAVVLNGGATPSYIWRVNGTIVGTNSDTYTYVPTDADIITCEVLSSEQCSSPNPATGTFTAVVSPLPNTSNIWHN